MGAPRETVESLKQGSVLKIETLERIKEGTNETLDAMIAQAHQESATYEQLDEDLSENNRNRNGNASNVAHQIIALLRRELDCLKREEKRCFERYIAMDKRVREKYKHKMDAADAASEDLDLLKRFKHTMNVLQNYKVFDSYPFDRSWHVSVPEWQDDVSQRMELKDDLAMYLGRRQDEESVADSAIEQAWDQYWLGLLDLGEREDRLGKAIELLEKNFT